MKKALALLLAALLLLSGAALAEEEGITLRFIRVGNDTAETNFWATVIEDYEAANPGITIEYISGQDQDAMLNTMFAANLAPDVIGGGIASLPQRASMGQYIPLDDYFAEWDEGSDMVERVLQNGYYDGTLYALGYSVTPYVFAYRIDLLEEAGLEVPTTWEELKEAALALTVRDENGVVTRAGFAFPMSGGNMVEYDVFVFGNGGRFTDEDMNPTIDTEEAIRERDTTGKIILISNEGHAYQRPMLTKAMFSGLEEDQMALHPQGWYDSRNITQMLHRQIERVDAEARTVVLDGGETVGYTKLIFALGSECFVPPIPGHEREGVIAIRRLEDVRRVQAISPLQQAVVIGGGVLGLEAASELRRNGCEVTVLELAPTLMSRQLDDASAKLLLAKCADFGVRVELGVQITALEGDTRVTGVRLGSGEVIPAQLVVVSCGVRANTAIAQAAGVVVDRAIVVNEGMETNLPGVFACGDCAQLNGVNYALWPQAQAQGKVAGARAAGDAVTYTPEQPILSFHGMGTELFSLGDPGKRPDTHYRTLELRDDARGHLARYYFAEGKLCGVNLVGDVSGMADAIAAMEEHRALKDFLA